MQLEQLESKILIDGKQTALKFLDLKEKTQLRRSSSKNIIQALLRKQWCNTIHSLKITKNIKRLSIPPCNQILSLGRLD